MRLLPVLSLTVFEFLLTFIIKYLSALPLTLGSYSSRAIVSALVLCICFWYRQPWAKYFTSCNLNCYQLVVMPRISHMRFFCLWSVNTCGLAPFVSLCTFNKFWLWLVVQVGDTVIALRNQRLPTKECNWSVLVKKWLTLSVCSTSTNRVI